MKVDYQQVIADFLKIQDGYQFTRRSSLTKERFRDVAGANEEIAFAETNPAIKESLIEHVGHLPVIASFFHEYASHAADIDLGRVLIILSIHDIGETELGDINTYDKTKAEESEEIAVATRMLSPTLLPYFEEYEEQNTLDAKYAKFVDAIAPVFHKLDMPYINQKRFHAKGRTTADIITKKRHLIEWDPFLLEVFDLCLDQLKRAEEGADLLFPAVDYDIN
jgi:5'-deoxynucleotidase YfbR-like HD superfamily hydrolase